MVSGNSHFPVLSDNQDKLIIVLMIFSNTNDLIEHHGMGAIVASLMTTQLNTHTGDLYIQSISLCTCISLCTFMNNLKCIHIPQNRMSLIVLNNAREIKSK